MWAPLPHFMCVYLYTHTYMEYTSHSERVSLRMSGSRQKELRQNLHKKPGIHAQESSTARLDTFLASKPKWMCPTLVFLTVWGACTPHAEFWTRVNFSKSPSAGTVFASLFAQGKRFQGRVRTRARCFMLFLNTSQTTALLPLVFHQPHFWKVFFNNDALS